MPALLLGHVVEELGGGREIAPQPVREALVDARILLLVGDGEGEHLALGELGERFHGRRGLLFRGVLNGSGGVWQAGCGRARRDPGMHGMQ